ncbi:immunity 49 family protein [Variovorax sp. S2]|uniref:immunity 49 family protein n=1 Tax=Variovorax sp. S12S4 TaxID=3029170 RepID=UPI00215C4C5B|nr:immunity 49 family protein [Variovorax sp. S12S4]MCR8961059.1 immunity 49 family protein [Variovorax sp. S12S4]
MNNLTREQGLQNVLNAEEASLPRQMDWFLHRRKSVRLGSILCGLAGLSETRGVHAYFIEGNAQAMKQHFYVASKLKLASLGQDGGADFSLPGDCFYALLSDNIEIINAMANVENPQLIRERGNPLTGRFELHMLQLAIRDEHEALQTKIEKMAKNGRKPWREECAKGEDFYSLLLKRDKAGLERLIQDKHARIKSVDVRIEDFMSYLGTLEAKLCWLKGIPVQIESPLVPMELMPIEPLAHYDDEYEFLKPGWVPLHKGCSERSVVGSSRANDWIAPPPICREKWRARRHESGCIRK